MPDTNGDWMLLASTGQGFAAPVDTGISSGAFGAHPVVADSEGRMLADLVGVNGSGDIELALRDGSYPDLVSKITDGLGNYFNLDWMSLSDPSIQTSVPINGLYELARRGPHLLANVTRNDGIGGNYTRTYAYDTPLRHRGGAFAGISKITATDSRNGHTVTTLYPFARFPTHLPLTIIWAQANGDPIHKEAYQTKTLDKAQPLELRTHDSTYYDQNGSKLYSVARAYTYNGDGDLTDTKVTTTGGGDSWLHETVLTPAVDPSGDCHGLVSSATVTDTLPAGQSKTRTTTFTPDYSHCRYTQFVGDSNLATALQTTTTLTYGSSFGNLKKVKIVGHKHNGDAMPARTTSYGYDARGEFKTSMTDPLGEVTQYGWDAALGVKTSETAPNGNTTSWTPDGFGRTTKVTLSSGAYRTANYQACTGGCTLWGYKVTTHRYTAGGNPSGAVQRYYDRLGRLYLSFRKLGTGAHPWAEKVRWRDPLGELVKTSAPYYDGSGASVHWTHYSYDALGRVKKVVAPAASGTATTTVKYIGLTTKVTDPAGNITHKTVNPLGQMVSVEDALGHTTSYQYAPFGQLAKVTGPDGTPSTMSYNGAGFRTSLDAPDLGGTLSFQTDSLGEVTRKADAAGHKTKYSYDTLGRMRAENFIHASGQNATWTYATSGNGAGQLKKAKANGFVRTLAYNAQGQTVTVTETYADGTAMTMHYGYDSLGRIASITYPLSVSADGAPTAEAGPDQSVVTGTWATLDGSGSSDPDGDTLSYSWSIVSGGGSPTLNDADQAVAQFQSETTGQWTLKLTVSDGTRSASDTVTVTVNARPDNAPTADAGPDQSALVRALVTLDGRGSSDPDGDPLTYQWSIVSGGGSPTLTGSDQAEAEFESNTVGQWTVKLTVSDGTESDSDTAQITVAPHAPGGLTATPTNSKGGNYSLSWGNVTGASVYQLWEQRKFTTPCLVYTGAKTGTSFTHHVNGNYSYFAEACVNGVCSAPSNAASVEVTGSPGTASACLDQGGGIHPNTAAPLIVQYHYDANGNLASVVNANTGTVYWQADANAQVPAVSAWGAPQAWTLGNGVHVRRDRYAATGAVHSVMAGPGENSASLVSLVYGYDARGNTASTLDVLTGLGRNFAYTDGMNRLNQTVIHQGGNATTLNTDYYAAGSIKSRTGLGHYDYMPTAAPPHAVLSVNKGSSVTHYVYNGVGEMVSGGALSQIQWWRNGRAKKIVGNETTQLAYGANGNLVQKTVAGTVSRYFGKLLVKTGDSYRARIVAGGEVVAIVNVNAAGYPTTDYLVHDAQGSPAALLDASGSVIYRYAWNAWGEMANPQTGAISDPNDPSVAQKEALLTIGYTGHEELWKAGLVHTWARLYNPHLGRWLSPDPTVPGVYDPQAFNRYSYALNNPATLIDENGYIPLGGPPPSGTELLRRSGYYTYLAETGGSGTLLLGGAEVFLAGIDYVGLGIGEALFPEFTPLFYAGFVANGDLAFNGFQNWAAAGSGRGPQPSPLDTAIGEVPNETAQEALMALEVASDPGDILKVVGKYAAELASLNGLHALAGATTDGGISSGGAGGAGRLTIGGTISLVGLAGMGVTICPCIKQMTETTHSDGHVWVCDVEGGVIVCRLVKASN